MNYNTISLSKADIEMCPFEIITVAGLMLEGLHTGCPYIYLRMCSFAGVFLFVSQEHPLMITRAVYIP